MIITHETPHQGESKEMKSVCAIKTFFLRLPFVRLLYMYIRLYRNDFNSSCERYFLYNSFVGRTRIE